MTVHNASELEGIVAADAHTAALVVRYAEAKRAAEDAKARVESLRVTLNTTFDAMNARKFSDSETGETIISRTEVQTPEAVDIPRLKARHPEAYADTVKPRSKFYRLTLPRISHR